MFDTSEINEICKEYRAFLSPENNYLRVKRLCHLCHNRVIKGFDRFYLEQRVKNAIGDGMKMYAANLSWKAPFLSREWVNAVWNMKQNMKFGSNWHRYAIHKNCPQLLGIQEEKTARPMRQSAEILYWMPFRKNLNRRLYSDYPLWFSTKIAREFIIDNSSIIDSIINRKVVEKIITEHQVKKNRTSSISFIFALIFWNINVESAAKSPYHTV
jgi:asparagine synthase (glutamine-hydrolysing)